MLTSSVLVLLTLDVVSLKFNKMIDVISASPFFVF